MRKMSILLCCAAMPLGIAGCGDDDEGDATRAVTLTVLESDDGEPGFVDAPPTTTVGDQGPKRLSPGDIVTFASKLKQNGKEVGDLVATCTVGVGGTFPQAKVTCVGTYVVPGGSLAAHVGGRIFAADGVSGAITGGTGKYAGASGTFTSQGDDDSRTTFTLRLPAED